MVGGSSAALPRARVRQGHVHFVALTSRIYCRRGNQRWMCLFPLAPPFAHSLEVPVNPLGSTQPYTCLSTGLCCLWSPTHPGCRAEQPACPRQVHPQGLLCWVPGSRRDISVLPPGPEKTFLGHRCILQHRKNIFMFQGKTLLRGCTLLSSISFFCFFKQNTFLCL